MTHSPMGEPTNRLVVEFTDAGAEVEFIPHGQGCEALVAFPDEMVPCGEHAVGTVEAEGRRRYVCHSHRTGTTDRRPEDG